MHPLWRTWTSTCHLHASFKLHSLPAAVGVLVSSTVVPMLPRKRINIDASILLNGKTLRLEALIVSGSDANVLESQFVEQALINALYAFGGKSSQWGGVGSHHSPN